jgi:hypothetical protein
MDVDTNTLRNGLHFLANIIIFAAFLFGRRLYITYSGSISIDVRQLIGVDPIFFSFFFSVDAVPLPSDFLRHPS